jgi:predicted amidohydrolase YtcJ
MMGLMLRNVQVDGVLTDVLLSGALVQDVGPDQRNQSGDEEIDGGGGALIPGLHDHHLHLLAAAAADLSIDLGPPNVVDRAQFVDVLVRAARALPDHSWVRGVGYHESVAGDLDRWLLDSLVPDNPVRIQHSSGAAWFLNSRALSAIGAESTDGRMFRQDQSLRRRPDMGDPPSLRPLSERLAAFGVTGITDATPSEEVSSIELLGRAATDGSLMQELTVTGGAALAAAPPIDGVRWGPVKFIITDHELPAFEAICDAYRVAHENARTIAVHCVTPVALALALAAWNEIGVRPGDRIEHGSVITPDAARRVAELGLAVVTQPGFIASRGDRYLREVDEEFLPFLYPCASLMDRGIRVGGSTDAPFGELDPWRAIAAATQRRTESGRVINSDERLSPERSLGLFLTPPQDPGGRPRVVAPGRVANVCLLDAPLPDALAHPSSDRVAATIIGGRIVYRR